MSLEKVCGGLVAKALNEANVILGNLGTVTFDKQLKLPPCEGTSLLINPIIDGPGKDDKGRMILFKVQTGQKLLNIGALSIMDQSRDGENIESTELLAHRIALAALSHLAVEKSGVADLDGLKMDLGDKNICQIDTDQGYLTIGGARVVIDFSKTEKPEYMMLRAGQIKAGLPQHFAKFGELDVVMMHDFEIAEDKLKEEFYFACKKFRADSTHFKDQETAQKHNGEYVKFFRLDAPSHRISKAWDGDIDRLKELRLEHINNKKQWKKPYDVNLYPDSGLEGIKEQIAILKKEF